MAVKLDDIERAWDGCLRVVLSHMAVKHGAWNLHELNSLRVVLSHMAVKLGTLRNHAGKGLRVVLSHMAVKLF